MMWYVFDIILINWLIYISTTVQQRQASLRLRHDLLPNIISIWFNLVEETFSLIYINRLTIYLYKFKLKNVFSSYCKNLFIKY